jgi:hypothetical protein
MSTRQRSNTSTDRARGRRTRIAGLAVAALAAAAVAAAPQTATFAAAPAAKPASVQALTTANLEAAPAKPVVAAKPYLGWSSWSLQATNYPGVNPDGGGSWISQAHILEQADAMASKLKRYGYEYVNIDAGWQDGADAYGRPVASTKRFPDGIAHVAKHVHELGLKLGIYTVVGIGADAYAKGSTPIYGAPGCHTSDIVYPDLRTTNGWDSSYKIDYTSQCAQAYADSIADVFAGWGVDFIKMDGVGPGSFKGGEQHDNQADVTAWHTAIGKTHRPIQYVLSWALSHRRADTWKANSNGWRIDTDVECYCDTLVTWDSSVKQRWNDVVQWIDDAGPGHWNNLDAVNVGVGKMDGLTKAERQSYMTFWAVEAAPLFAGDDLTKLDDYGLSLLTNRDVITIDQAGIPARPVDQRSDQQVWYAPNGKGGVTVALFNLGSQPAAVTADWSDVGLAGPATVRDVWAKRNLGTETGSISATLPAHGSRLFTITPRGDAPAVPTQLRATDAGAQSISLSWKASPTQHGSAPSYQVYDNGRKVATTRATVMTVAGLTASSRHRFTVEAFGRQHERSGASTALPITTTGPGGPVVYQAEDPANTIIGTASIGGCEPCSGGAKVGNLGGTSSFTFTTIHAPVAGNYLVTMAYVDGSASRQAVLTVNGAQSVGVNFQGSNDDDWNHPQEQKIMVSLKAGTNTINVGHPTWYVSDIDAFTL